MADSKKYLRAILSESRKALSPQRAAALSAEIQARLLATPCYRDAAAVVLYAAIDNEVGTGLILADSLRAGRKVYYPLLDSNRRALLLAPIRDRAELAAGAFGILEPPAENAIPPRRLGPALLCVPGLAFTAAGSRLGRGRGHYDRLLTEVTHETIAAGIAYSFQLLDALPQARHDRRLDLVVTEFAVHAAASYAPASKGRLDRGGTARCLHC